MSQKQKQNLGVGVEHLPSKLKTLDSFLMSCRKEKSKPKPLNHLSQLSSLTEVAKQLRCAGRIQKAEGSWPCLLSVSTCTEETRLELALGHFSPSPPSPALTESQDSEKEEIAAQNNSILPNLSTTPNGFPL